MEDGSAVDSPSPGGPLFYDDVPELVPYEEYDHFKAKNRATILWLVAKAQTDGRIPNELRDPFYRDLNGHELIKPWITQRMASGELYGRALANIYGVPDYSSFSHQNVLQLLQRRGVFSDELAKMQLGEQITETMLLKTCPVKLDAHLLVTDCIMTLYIREILIPIKVMEVTARFAAATGDDEELYTELPPSTEPEDVALYWVNRACLQLNQEMQEAGGTAVPWLDEMSDMCDGCSLYGLLAFYCPGHVDWRDICLKSDISIGDSIYNLQRVQYFCQQLFPSDICFLQLEDLLYLPETIVPNFLAFLADLLFMFEIQPAEAVMPPYLRLYPDQYQEDLQPNYPAIPTPSEMKAKSLKSSWNQQDSIETSSGSGAGAEYLPAAHPVYDRASYPHRVGSSANLSGPQPSRSSSRRNSFVGQKLLKRRSSLLSNGSDQHGAVEENIYTEPLEMPEPGADPTGQLSQYFSSLSIAGKPPGAEEYAKNRSRASGGHLTDYFSSLSNVNAAGSAGGTHVRAQRHHPNNADNVKQLLGHTTPAAYSSQADSQTNSSDTSSSVAEMSECSDIRAQLSQKRRQIEADRQHEREKRASSDHNFRQEVFKTLKGIVGTDHTDFASGKPAPEDENLTFEIHELNPIRREKTFTSIPGSLAKPVPGAATLARKNLFSASEDLKASMSDLNYANAKDYYNASPEIKTSRGPTAGPQSPESPPVVAATTTDKAPAAVVRPEPVEPVPPPAEPEPVPSAPVPAPAPAAAPQRRSQWGQPMIPLAGHQPVPPPPVHPYQAAGWSAESSWPYQPAYHHPAYPYGYGPPPPIHHPPRPFDPYGANGYPYGPALPGREPPAAYLSSAAVNYAGNSSQLPAPPPLPAAPHHNASYSVSAPGSGPVSATTVASGPISTGMIENPNSIAAMAEASSSSPPPVEAEREPATVKPPSEPATFFISFNDQQPQARETRPKRSVSTEKKALGGDPRPATGSNQRDQLIQELYNVRRPCPPPVPAVSFVIPAADQSARHSPPVMTNGTEEANSPPHWSRTSLPSIQSEEEMARKKEAIMKQSLRRRALQESKRLQKEQELAVKRERERIKREQIERKKEEDREKRALILEQYKRRKQLAEEIEKNGGAAALQGPPPALVGRSSSTLILNRGSPQQQQMAAVTMRTGRPRPRPKSLHGASLALDVAGSMATLSSGSSARLSASRDEMDELMSSLSGRMSGAPSVSSSRPQSAMSSQLCSAVTTPTGVEHSFAAGLLAEMGQHQAPPGSGPASSSFYQEYNGPKLFVKPSQKSNKTLILNAINVVLAGTVNAETNRRVTEVINKCDSKYYLILFRNSGLQYRAIYSYNPERELVSKLDGIGPKSVHNDMIDKFYKYNSGTKSFTPIQTKHLCVTIDAFTIHNQLWMSKAKQQQQQSTPRRFLP